jgi:Tfp pilus assembly protein PilO
MQQISWQAIFDAVNGIVTKYYRWFVLGVVVVVGWFGWALLLQGEYEHIRDSGILQYNNRVQQREDRKATLLQLQDLSAEVESLHHERLQQMETALPVGLDPVEMITQMQAFADAAGVSILSVDVVKSGAVGSAATADVKTEESTDVPSVQFTSDSVRTAIVAINVETPDASYADLKKFLDTLESFVPILNLRNLSYAPATTSFALQLETYYIDSETTP